MQTIQFTQNTDDDIKEFIILIGAIESQLRQVNENLENINQTLKSIGQDSEQIAYLKQFERK